MAGIELPIPTRGIFPKIDDPDAIDSHTQNELEDAATQMGHGEILNYSSVRDNLEDARIELDRYRKEGYLADVDKETVQKEMAHGTISKLGLIVKEKPEGVKRRIILDLRRSGGNQKATLPERLVLPRPQDAVNMIRDVYNQRRVSGADEGYTRELVVIDVSDAFMALAVHESELPHTLAPNVDSSDFCSWHCSSATRRPRFCGLEWPHSFLDCCNPWSRVPKLNTKPTSMTGCGHCKGPSKRETAFYR